MYEFVDRPVTGLDAGGRFLIWSMRSWTAAIGGNHCPAPQVASAFAKWNMIGGLQHFHRAMLLLSRDALETICFAPLACNRVCEHEAIVLSLLDTIAAEKTSRARDLLAMLIEEASIGDMLAALGELCGSLARASLLPGVPLSGPQA